MTSLRRMRPIHGFTLIEIAIVLVIVGLLLGGLLMPLSAQIEQQRIKQTQQTLEEIKEALMGFAMTTGRLPRPAVSATDGSERPVDCITLATVPAREAACTGLIPWSRLGVSKLDAWGKIIRYSVTPAFATNTPNFTLVTLPTKDVQTRNPPAFAPTPLATNVPAVIFSYGKENFGTTDTGVNLANNSAGGTNVDEIANNATAVNFFSRISASNTTATGGEFDDLVVWLPAPILFTRMVAAGQL